MITQFPDWFMLVHPDPSSDLVDRRWSFIEDISSEISNAEVIELSRMYFGKPCKNNQFSEEFPTLVQKHDSAFAPTHHKREIALLAGVVLANLATNNNLSIFSALCPQFFGLSKDQSNNYIGYITPYIENLLTQQASKLRLSTKIKLSYLEQITIPDMDVLLSPWNQAEIPQNGPAISTHINDLYKITEGLIGTINILTKERLLYSEESDILWWLVGGYSRGLQLPFEELSPSLPLIVGKELAEMVHVLPGPYCAKAILERALLQGNSLKENISIESLLSALPSEWISRYSLELANLEIVDLCPLHWSILRFSEDSSLSSWHSSFEKHFGISAKTEIPPLKIASQIYRECLFIKSLDFQKGL